MKKMILIALAIALIAGIVGTGTAVLAQSSAGATPSLNSNEAAGKANLTKGQFLRRLLLIQNEAKVDSLLANAVTNNKLTKDQASKLKTFWQNNHTKMANLVKRILAKRILSIKDEAKLKQFLAEKVAANRLTQAQANRIIAFWEKNHK